MNWLANRSAATVLSQPLRCGNPLCRPGQWRRWTNKCHGTRLNAAWYCSEDCLGESLSDAVDIALRDTCVSRRSPHRLPLGLLLVSRGAIDQDQLLAALDMKRRSPSRRIGECLEDLGLVTERDVTRALGAQHCLPVLSAVSPIIDQSVPLQLQKLTGAICFRSYGGSSVHVGFGAAVDFMLVTAIEEMLQLRAEACIVPSRIVSQKLQVDRLPEGNSEVVFETHIGSSDVVRSILSYAHQIGADRIAVARTRSYLWSRLNGTRRRFDLLFRIDPTLKDSWSMTDRSTGA